MDRLSSCYFCGAAMDAPVREYPVVPAELDPDPDAQATVALCPTCRRKLAGVLERLLDATAGVDGTEVLAGDPGPADPGPPDAGAPAGPAGPGGAAGGDDVSTDADAPGTAGADHGEAAPDPAADTDAPGEPRPVPERRRGDEGGDAGGTGNVEETGDADDVGDTGETGDADETRDVDDMEDSDGSGGTRAGITGERAVDAPDDADLEGISVLAYNKVLWLLENREFPVPREEIRAVATSAYDLSPSEFEAVLDVAIARGLLEDDEGLLRRGDG